MVLFRADWLKIIEDKNASLREQGRKPISRYHTADCQFRVKEFKGWNIEEKDDFCKRLFALFERYKMHVVGYSINLQDLAEEIPEAAANRPQNRNVQRPNHRGSVLAYRRTCRSNQVIGETSPLHSLTRSWCNRLYGIRNSKTAGAPPSPRETLPPGPLLHPT